MSRLTSMKTFCRKFPDIVDTNRKHCLHQRKLMANGGFALKVEPLSPFGVLVLVGSKEELLAEHETLFSLAHEYSLLCIRGIKDALPKEEFIEFCKNRNQNKLIYFDDEAAIDIRLIPDNPNYLFSKEEVPYHFDGAFHQMPRYLIWNCVEAFEGLGGETLFVNGEMLVDELCQRGITEEVKVSYHIEKLVHFGGAVTKALIEKHPHKDVSVLRYAEPVLTNKNPLSLTVHNVQDEQNFINTMHELLYQGSVTIEHKWEKGDLVIADNYSLLHGRKPLGYNLGRHIRRVHVA